MKLVHHILGNDSSLYSNMNKAIQRIVKEKWNPCVFVQQEMNIIKKEKFTFVADISTNDYLFSSNISFPIDSLEAILVSTLTYTIRNKSTESDKSMTICDATDTDLRPELSLEMLNILFIIQSVESKYKNTQNINSSEIKDEEKKIDKNQAILTQIGILFTDILHLSNHNHRIYKVKLAVVNLLLDAPDSYGQYLQTNQALPCLWRILELQLNEVVDKNSQFNGKRSDAVVLLPILLLWSKFIEANPLIQAFCRDKIFPPDMQESDSSYDQKLDKSSRPSYSKAKTNMSPVDAPKGTIRYKLIKLMTWLESNIKRAASELLWIVCEEDPVLFVKRTGFGNAAHLLGMKGLVNLPSS